jgi:hypothetical protein
LGSDDGDKVLGFISVLDDDLDHAESTILSLVEPRPALLKYEVEGLFLSDVT